jgi:hypothetical protein
MAKGSSKSTTAIERLLEERRQYQAWITRLSAAEDATPAHVRERVKADYQARLQAVLDELKSHADAARQTIEQKKSARLELRKREAMAAEKLAETELRHAVGEYDEAAWSQVHAEAQAELLALREEMQAIDGDIAKLQELDDLVRATPKAPGPTADRAGPPTLLPARRHSGDKPGALDELAFIKSVTEDEKGSAPSPRRASGGHYQPPIPSTTPTPVPRAAVPPPSVLPTPPADEGVEEPRTLKCRDCGTMNLPTEWYCEQCGAELAAV